MRQRPTLIKLTLSVSVLMCSPALSQQLQPEESSIANKGMLPPQSTGRPGASQFSYQRGGKKFASGEETTQTPINAPNGRGSRPNPATFFDGLDKNNDGKISKTEARPRMLSRWGRMDTNGDGFLDKDEQQRIKKRLGNGSQSSNPMRERRQTSVVENVEDATEPLKRYMDLDANSDGAISILEIDSRFISLISRADRNQDGIVTEEELVKMLRDPKGNK